MPRAKASNPSLAVPRWKEDVGAAAKAAADYAKVRVGISQMPFTILPKQPRPAPIDFAPPARAKKVRSNKDINIGAVRG